MPFFTVVKAASNIGVEPASVRPGVEAGKYPVALNISTCGCAEPQYSNHARAFSAFAVLAKPLPSGWTHPISLPWCEGNGAVMTCTVGCRAADTDLSEPVWCQSIPACPVKSDWKIWLYPSAGALGGADLSMR